MITTHDYAMALDVQDACNLSGVVFAFAEAMRRICDEAQVNGHGTDWKNTHPIAVMYASKIASLTRADTDTNIFVLAMDECEARSKRTVGVPR